MLTMQLGVFFMSTSSASDTGDKNYGLVPANAEQLSPAQAAQVAYVRGVEELTALLTHNHFAIVQAEVENMSLAQSKVTPLKLKAPTPSAKPTIAIQQMQKTAKTIKDRLEHMKRTVQQVSIQMRPPTPSIASPTPTSSTTPSTPQREESQEQPKDGPRGSVDLPLNLGTQDSFVMAQQLPQDSPQSMVTSSSTGSVSSLASMETTSSTTPPPSPTSAPDESPKSSTLPQRSVSSANLVGSTTLGSIKEGNEKGKAEGEVKMEKSGGKDLKWSDKDVKGLLGSALQALASLEDEDQREVFFTQADELFQAKQSSPIEDIAWSTPELTQLLSLLLQARSKARSIKHLNQANSVDFRQAQKQEQVLSDQINKLLQSNRLRENLTGSEKTTLLRTVAGSVLSDLNTTQRITESLKKMLKDNKSVKNYKENPLYKGAKANELKQAHEFVDLFCSKDYLITFMSPAQADVLTRLKEKGSDPQLTFMLAMVLMNADINGHSVVVTESKGSVTVKFSAKKAVAVMRETPNDPTIKKAEILYGEQITITLDPTKKAAEITGIAASTRVKAPVVGWTTLNPQLAGITITGESHVKPKLGGGVAGVLSKIVPMAPNLSSLIVGATSFLEKRFGFETPSV
jgi:hypothetical protein